MDSSRTLRTELLRCLGGSWPEPPSLQSRVLRTERGDGYRREWGDYLAEPEERIPAIVLIPDGVDATCPAPAIAVWHQHAGQWHLGKSEPVGLAGDPMHHTGLELVRLGYVVLCPDALCFEDRQDPQGKLLGDEYERFEFLRYLVHGKCMAWKNILDMQRAIDYLTSRPDVASDRLGCFGHSMGATHAWLLGPWETRLKCVVASACLPTYDAIERTKLLHCFPNFIPGFRQVADTPDIAALIAPRPLHLNFGENDEGSPIDEVRRGIETIAKAYQNENAEDAFSVLVEPDVGHVLSPRMWQATVQFLERHLIAR